MRPGGRSSGRAGWWKQGPCPRCATCQRSRWRRPLRGPIPDLSAVPGVRSIRTDGQVVHLQVNGSIQPLLKVLAESSVSELLSREPSLEELFLALYGHRKRAPGHLTASSPLTAEVAVRAPTRVERPPGGVVFHHTARKAARSGGVFGYIFGVVVVSSAVSYTRIYKTPAEREQLAAAFGSNRASAALFGPARALQTVAGFTIFKSMMTLMVLGAVWGLLTSTAAAAGRRGRRPLGASPHRTDHPAASRGSGPRRSGGGRRPRCGRWRPCSRSSPASTRRSISARGPMLYFSVAQVATAVMFLGRRRADQPAGPHAAGRPPATPAGSWARPSPCGWLPTPVSGCTGSSGPRRSAGSRNCSRSPPAAFRPLPIAAFTAVVGAAGGRPGRQPRCRRQPPARTGLEPAPAAPAVRAGWAFPSAWCDRRPSELDRRPGHQPGWCWD